MFDKLEGLLIRFEEIMSELNEPNVANNQERFRKLMKEQSDLTPIVEAFKEYKKSKQDIEDSLSMLEIESDEDMREMLKEELSEAKKRVEELEDQLKSFFFQRTLTMKRTLLLKFVQVQVETKLLSLLQKYIVCMYTMQKADVGE